MTSFSKPLLQAVTAAIAEEHGCPSWIRGTADSFAYCCDKDSRAFAGKCFCEEGAKRAIQLCSAAEKVDA